MSDKNLHAGHRQRMLKKYRENGIECFEEHEVLEMLLFLVFSRCNTNDISHALIERFGSVNGVLSADRNELMEVGNIGETASTYISFIGDFFRWLPEREERKIQLNTPQRIIEYCEPIFSRSTKEMTYILILDSRQNMICRIRLNFGGPESTSVCAKDIIRNAVIANSSNVVLVHNHTSGSPSPSIADINATRDIYNALRTAGIVLVDHIIIGSDGEGYSMRSAEILRDIWS